MPPAHKHKPPSLSVCNDKQKSDMILRIVSPIAPQFVNQDMRNTLRLSETIRTQQNNLIASGHYQKSLNSSDSNSSSDLMSSSSSTALDTNATSSHTVTESSLDKDLEPGSNLAWSGRELSPGTKDDSRDISPISVVAEGSEYKHESTLGNKETEHREENDHSEEASRLASPYYSDNNEFKRMASAMSRKKLKRDNLPGDLKILPSASGPRSTPSIRSAPLRPSAALPYGMPRWVPVRYVYPALPQVPYTAMQDAQTPWRRNMPANLERRPSRVRSPRRSSITRRKPVLDVFQGDTIKFAPLSSQPPSAQLETFVENHDDNEEATEEEMRELNHKRKVANAELTGSICFNDTSLYNFKIFKGNESSAKEKFLKICETTWNEYVSGI